MAESSPRARWLTLVAMTLANSMILVDQTAVPLAIPHTIADLGGSLSTSQWVLTANVLPLAAFMVFAGRLGDQLGLRRVFLAGALVFIVSSAMAGAAPSFRSVIGDGPSASWRVPPPFSPRLGQYLAAC